MWESRAGKQARSGDVEGEQLRDAGASDLSQWHNRRGPGIVHQHVDSSPPTNRLVDDGRGRAGGANVGNNGVIAGCVSAVSRKLTSRRPTPRTWAPACANATAVARPIPDPAPVTITVRPAS